MAKILFISLNDINATGIRTMSSVLKQKGHESHIVFLQKNGFPATKTRRYAKVSRVIEDDDWVGIDKYGRDFSYAKGPKLNDFEKKSLIALIPEISPDVIGISVTTPNKKRAIEVSDLLKKNYPSIVLIWGGPHPTIQPEDALNYCDFACVGEGEKTILEIADKIDKKEDLNPVNNLCYLKDNLLTKNPLYPPIKDLDELPFKDILPTNKYLIEKNLLIRNFNGFNHSNHYHILTSRGCPFACSYCFEEFFRRLYSNEKFLRRRSPANVIMELKAAREKIDFKIVHFEDEIFSLDLNWLWEFKELYKKEIDLPFICYIYGLGGIDEQLKILKEMGLFSTCLALQSGSERINRDIFNRYFRKEEYVETAKMLKLLKIGFYVDVITYNPIENEQDLQCTLEVLSRLPKPFDVCINHLYILEGLKIKTSIENYKNEEKPPNETFNYYCRLFWLTMTNRGQKILNLIKEKRIFRNHPFLITCLYVTIVLLPKRINSIYLKSIDRRIGMMGIFLNKNFPRLYSLLRKLKNGVRWKII